MFLWAVNKTTCNLVKGNREGKGNVMTELEARMMQSHTENASSHQKLEGGKQWTQGHWGKHCHNNTINSAQRN